MIELLFFISLVFILFLVFEGSNKGSSRVESYEELEERVDRLEKIVKKLFHDTATLKVFRKLHMDQHGD